MQFIERLLMKILYISKFVEWLQHQRTENETKGLSKQTFETAIRTCKAILALVHYLFKTYPNLNFLLGNTLSDFWREDLAGGGNYAVVTIRTLVRSFYKLKRQFVFVH